MTHWESVDVKCPFYISEKEIRISCEGLKEELKSSFSDEQNQNLPMKISNAALPVSIHLVFENKKSKDRFKICFCNSGYERCPIYKMLMDEKYNT